MNFVHVNNQFIKASTNIKSSLNALKYIKNIQ